MKRAARSRQHVFLSYRSLERGFALKLAAALRNAGVIVWVDCLEDGIRVGDDWPCSIEEALNTCCALVAVVSPDYVASKVCLLSFIELTICRVHSFLFCSNLFQPNSDLLKLTASSMSI